MAGKKFTELMSLTAGIVPEKIIDSSNTKPKTAPGQMMSLATQRDDAFSRAEKAEASLIALEAQLRETQKQTGFLEIPLEELHKVEGRQRLLSEEERSQLKENLRRHPLGTPITVEVRKQGGFNIVSGHNRVDIYRELDAEDGNKKTIKACLIDANPEIIDDISFFANLLHSSLPAYEKYIGLKKIRNKNPENPLTHEALSELTGVTRTTVTELLRFDDLPAEALDLLKSKPNSLGARGAAALASIHAKGQSQKVIEAIRRLVTENINESEAIKLASTEPIKSNSKPQPITLKMGRTTFCTLLGIKNTIRVEFKNEADRTEAEAALKEVLEKQMARKKSGDT